MVKPGKPNANADKSSTYLTLMLRVTLYAAFSKPHENNYAPKDGSPKSETGNSRDTLIGELLTFVCVMMARFILQKKDELHTN